LVADVEDPGIGRAAAGHTGFGDETQSFLITPT
jgi:hypothetical protein